ncbi:TetR/AcrR family transcriptional regulator [Naasia lichenicola]|uniref:TetR/AcrR family transcriptional regulator n=1 Tax=Naasia lichenicola TaxID=2565933 RepID=A0A4S4FJD9_9MICO|nr:TetR/AcrR family transcriptional regulator [Naasia lichenicola]THG30024.1 TetR/AcrR family transcriptional regulator [Naasia lichenicola]
MASRGRRNSRPSGDEREEAILIGAERLLQDRSLAAISIEELATTAGLSRPAFYFYFSSKDDVLLALLDRVISEVDERVASLPRDFAADPYGAWRRSIGTFVDVFTAHRAIAAAAMNVRQDNQKVRELWSTSMQSWVGYSANVIAAERDRGAAPGGLDAHTLATALNLMNERVLLSALTDEDPRVHAADALDALTRIWVLGIYGSTDLLPH